MSSPISQDHTYRVSFGSEERSSTIWILIQTIQEKPVKLLTLRTAVNYFVLNQTEVFITGPYFTSGGIVVSFFTWMKQVNEAGVHCDQLAENWKLLEKQMNNNFKRITELNLLSIVSKLLNVTVQLFVLSWHKIFRSFN